MLSGKLPDYFVKSKIAMSERGSLKSAIFAQYHLKALEQHHRALVSLVQGGSLSDESRTLVPRCKVKEPLSSH